MVGETSNIQKKIKLPFPIEVNYPTRLQRIGYKSQNFLRNCLYPFHPLIFVSFIVVFVAIYLRYYELNDLSSALKLLSASLLSAYLPLFAIRKFLKYFYYSYKGFLFEHPKNISLRTISWSVIHKLLSVISPRLESCNSLLPNLPLPPLRATTLTYLETIEPILNKDQFELIEKLANEFLNREGIVLQFFAWIYSVFVNNYVTYFWEKYAYLSSRDSLLINTSVAHCDLFKEIEATQAERAAHITYIESMSMLAVDNQSLTPIANGIVSTTHYKKCYACSRIPGKFIDSHKTYGISRHVVVYHKGCLYKVNVFDENGKVYSIEHLTRVYSDLLNRDEILLESEGSICALTTDRRDRWASNRQKFFLNNPKNRAALEIIESAIVFITLDDESYDYQPQIPELLDKFCRNMLTGDGKNRWADKSLNYVISKNGRCGGTVEHSVADGPDFIHIMENFIYTDLNILSHKYGKTHINDTYAEKTKDVDNFAERISFDINAEMSYEIKRSLSNYKEMRDDVDVSSIIFREFGKGQIKKQKISPDAFMQMAIQHASYKDQGKFLLTYESASVRFFANSRTETLRTIGKESCQFVMAMMDENTTKDERIELLRNASSCHSRKTRECMVGKGVDRHLFVLYVLSQIFGIKSRFLDYYISQSWYLSTSQAPKMTSNCDEDLCPDNSWIGALFGAVCKEGYGICYRFAGNHSICLHVTSYISAQNTDSHRFQKHLIDSINEMNALFL